MKQAVKSKFTHDPPVLSRRFRVGVRLPDWSNGFAFRLFAGLLEFQRRGTQFDIHFNQPSGGDLPAELIDDSWDGDGLLVFRYTSEEAEAWKKRGVSVVNLSAETPDDSPVFPRVTIDNRLVARRAAEHLAALGLRDFAFINDPNRRYSEERMDGFCEAVEKIGGRFHRIDVPISTFDIGERPSRVEEQLWIPLAKLPHPCGVFAKDDIASVLCLRMMKRLGIHCPNELPLIGVGDDIVFCHTTDPPLSSIAYPGRAIGYAAADLLHRMMSGEKIAPNDRLRLAPGALISRESTRHVVFDDAAVSKALAMIRTEGLRRRLSVVELSRAVGLSRESLRQRFQAALGHSPKDEIEQARCRHVCELLRSTDWTLEGIADACGFPGSDEVCRFIRRMTGKTPGNIRREDVW